MFGGGHPGQPPQRRVREVAALVHTRGSAPTAARGIPPRACRSGSATPGRPTARGRRRRAADTSTTAPAPRSGQARSGVAEHPVGHIRGREITHHGASVSASPPTSATSAGRLAGRRHGVNQATWCSIRAVSVPPGSRVLRTPCPPMEHEHRAGRVADRHVGDGGAGARAGRASAPTAGGVTVHLHPVDAGRHPQPGRTVERPSRRPTSPRPAGPPRSPAPIRPLRRRPRPAVHRHRGADPGSPNRIPLPPHPVRPACPPRDRSAAPPGTAPDLVPRRSRRAARRRAAVTALQCVSQPPRRGSSVTRQPRRQHQRAVLQHHLKVAGAARCHRCAQPHVGQAGPAAVRKVLRSTAAGTISVPCTG